MQLVHVLWRYQRVRVALAKWRACTALVACQCALLARAIGGKHVDIGVGLGEGDAGPGAVGHGGDGLGEGPDQRVVVAERGAG